MLTYKETLYPHWGQFFTVDEVIYQKKTKHQDLIIFDNDDYGRVLALDGVIQTTERDEFVYHEMLAHVPIFAHGHARRILIVGGGDGAMLREVVRHRPVESITQVEIDAEVIETSKRYLPNHSRGAFDDSRVEVVIGDGVDFVRSCNERFDVIISDSTDPIGPGEALYSSEFYEGCHRCLRSGGVLVTQNGVAFKQLDEVRETAVRLALVFADVHFFSAAVPTYVGGSMVFAWASDNVLLRKTAVDELRRRFEESELETEYYTPEVHVGSFALPRFVIKAIESSSEPK